MEMTISNILRDKCRLTKNRKKLDFKMCACTILKLKTFSPQSLAPQSPEGLAQRRTPRTTKVT
jgi:hypothetical protein